MLSSPERVQWAELTSAEFRQRRASCPLAYLPVGLCEPHGPGTPLGLDLIKAERLCIDAARAGGGIVAPSLGFHIHECGPSARWLYEQVGEAEPHLGSVGPLAMAHFLVHQLRALANASIAAAFVVSGHAGAHAADLAQLVDAFGIRFGMRCRYVTDVELARPAYEPDHAGKYELSVLWHLRPDLMANATLDLPPGTPPEERLALGATSAAADRAWGAVVFAHLVDRLHAAAGQLVDPALAVARRITFQEVEAFLDDYLAAHGAWACFHPREAQPAVPAGSRWKTEEHL